MPAVRKIVRRRRGRLDRVAMKAREAAIIADLKAGKLSYRMIAEKHRVSLPTVNAKARKAGVRRPRGRRPMVAMKAAVARRRGRPRKIRVAPVAMAKVRRRRARRVGRPAGRPRGVRVGGAGFADAFREMVLRYYPGLTLKKFDRLARLIARAVA